MNPFMSVFQQLLQRMNNLFTYQWNPASSQRTPDGHVLMPDHWDPRPDPVEMPGLDVDLLDHDPGMQAPEVDGWSGLGDLDGGWGDCGDMDFGGIGSGDFSGMDGGE